MIDPRAFLQSWTADANASSLRAAERFLAPANAHRRYVMGRNEHAAALDAAIGVVGFIDDFAGDAHEWCGKPVLTTSDAPADALIVHGVFSQKPQSAWRSLSAARGESALCYASLLHVAPSLVPLPNFVSEMRDDVERNPDGWRTLYESLEDETSRCVFRDLFRYRLTGDISFMAGYEWNVGEQYFDAVARTGDAPVFVDAGGFDGDTAEAFCAHYPNYRRVYVFEPSPENMHSARARLSRHSNIVFDQRGLGAVAGRVRFEPANGSSSAISESGSAEIEIVTIDEAVMEPASFIKMDIEGGEYDGLRGAAGQIEAHAPTLALAVYHSARDFWRLHAFTKQLRADYRLYLRHYTEGWAESVLYLVAR
ncbi:MAG: FkbM family methyltransferase [Caulobacterales bacterium]